MKKREFYQLKDKPKIELEEKLITLKDRFWNLKKELIGGKVKNVKEIKQTKKDIARIMTLLKVKK